MKKLFLFFPLIIAFNFAYSTVINVDNDPNRPSGYYSNLQLAINNASIGDTIYLYPSNTSYGDITINKRLYVFGSGYSGKTSGYLSRIQTLTLDTATSPASNPSGSSLQGLTIGEIKCSKPNISNIIISGNFLYYSYNVISLKYNCSGWLITNNLIYSYISIYNNGAIIISNNIFEGGYSYNSGISQSNAPSVVISHNLFMNFNYFGTVYNASISDNVFICTGEYTSGTQMAHNTFTNNISYRDGATNDYDLPPISNTGTGNISNTNPMFVDGTLTGTYVYTKDYHLQSSSPAKAAATDGTEIGPYGGSNSFVWGGAFTIPKVTMTNITNPVINQATPINVNIKAKKAEL